ncbi:MAG: glucosidase, partial [Planctomycetota bacterium]
PAESTTDMFGGNSNWRGPIWFPLNYLFIEALERYHHFYGTEMSVTCPTSGGTAQLDLRSAAHEVERRLVALFEPDADGSRPCHGEADEYAERWNDLVLFYEFFHGDTGRGCGASHQTGWTALIANILEKLV